MDVTGVASQWSTYPAAFEKAFIGCVLFDVSSRSLLGCVVMVFGLLHRRVGSWLRIMPPTLLAAIGRRNWRHVAGSHLIHPLRSSWRRICDGTAEKIWCEILFDTAEHGAAPISREHPSVRMEQMEEMIFSGAPLHIPELNCLH